MTTFTTQDREDAEREPIPFAGWVQHSDDTVTRAKSLVEQAPYQPGYEDAVPVREVEIVDILPTEFWYEKDMMGTISIKMQHQGMNEFALVQINYDYAYTSNAHQLVLLQDICKLIGIDNIKQRPSKFDADLMRKAQEGK